MSIPVKPSDPTLQARVPNWLADGASELAKLQGVPVSEVIREAIKEHLANHGIYAPGRVTAPTA